MGRDLLELPSMPSPSGSGPPRHSLRHVRIKVKKSWLTAAAWTAIVTVSGWVTTSVPYVWSWEKHQVTDSQLGHVLYDTIDRDTGKPAPAAIFDEATLPPEGVVKRLLVLEERTTQLTAALAASKAETATLRALIIDQYRWRVRTQAATSEPDARKRMDAANRAEAKFLHAVDAGKPLDEAYRLALERNPYQ